MASVARSVRKLPAMTAKRLQTRTVDNALAEPAAAAPDTATVAVMTLLPATPGHDENQGAREAGDRRDRERGRGTGERP